MKVILISPDAEVRGKLKFALESRFASDVHAFKNAKDATRKGPASLSPNLIILEKPKIERGDLIDLRLLPQKTPLLVLCDEIAEPKDIEAWSARKIKSRQDLVKDTLSSVQEFIEEKKIDAEAVRENFCRIQTRLLLQTYPLEGDIYIRLSDAKFVKLMLEGDRFDANDLEKYTLKKGIEYLYVRFDQVREFLDKYARDLRARIDEQDSMNPQDVQKLQEAQHETAQELIRKHPEFAADVQILAKSYVKSTLKTLARTPHLRNLLDRLKDYEGKYIATHSTHSGYVSCAIASQMDWGSDATFYKLTLAAFMHDITLTDNALAQIESLQEAEEKGLDRKAIQEIRLHPARAAEFAQAFQEVPPGVDAIVLQHHENAEGTGFPRALTHAYIAPLAAVFIVGHDLSAAMVEKRESFSLGEYLTEARERFKGGQFRKVLEAVEKLDSAPVEPPQS